MDGWMDGQDILSSGAESHCIILRTITNILTFLSNFFCLFNEMKSTTQKPPPKKTHKKKPVITPSSSRKRYNVVWPKFRHQTKNVIVGKISRWPVSCTQKNPRAAGQLRNCAPVSDKRKRNTVWLKMTSTELVQCSQIKSKRYDFRGLKWIMAALTSGWVKYNSPRKKSGKKYNAVCGHFGILSTTQSSAEAETWTLKVWFTKCKVNTGRNLIAHADTCGDWSSNREQPGLWVPNEQYWCILGRVYENTRV